MRRGRENPVFASAGAGQPQIKPGLAESGMVRNYRLFPQSSSIETHSIGEVLAIRSFAGGNYDAKLVSDAQRRTITVVFQFPKQGHYEQTARFLENIGAKEQKPKDPKNQAYLPGNF